MDKYIQELDEGTEIGMPLHGSTILNSEIAGMHLGTIMGIGASSGVGKSWLAFNYLIPSALKYNERVVVICNEEDEGRWRRELLIYVVNNVFGHRLQKRELRNGKFTDEIWDWLREATDWIKEKANEHIVTVVPLQSYNVDLAIKIIKKYSSAFGCRYFVLDTLKESNNTKTDDIFKSMTRDTIKLYDLVKPSNKNLFLMVTYQLNKLANKVRHLTNLEIGMSKSIIDVMSTNILVRRPNYDEYEGEPKAINCYKEVSGARIHFPLRKDNNYFIIFLSKNRYGRSDAFQIVAKIDMSTNEYEEVGACNILEDW
jgi:replicative DNA helicase